MIIIKLRTYIRRYKKISVGLVIIVLAFAAFSFSGRNKAPAYDTFVVKRASIFQEVSVTGKTTPTESVELAFEKLGKVSYTSKGVGDRVSRGEALVGLDAADLKAQLQQATANVDAQQAKLDDLLRGGSSGTTQVSSEYINVKDIINDAYAKAENAIRVQTAAIFNGSADSGYSLALSGCSSDTHGNVGDLLAKRRDIEYELTTWKKNIDTVDPSASVSVLDAALKDSDTHLLSFRSFLYQANSVFAVCTGSSAPLTSALTNLNAGISTINAAISSVQSKEQSIISQTYSISAQQAQVKQARANADSIQAQISKMTLWSPIAGVITKQDAKVGEIISPNVAIVSVISDNQMEIDANIPEADIAKIKVGDRAKVTLDAYGSDVVFDASVSSVDPAETIIEGVPTYKTKLQFASKDDRIKSGMTANIDVQTAQKENVLIIPQRAVIAAGTSKKVRILKDKTESDREIKTGLRGTDGNIEVVDGLQEGDVVILPD